MQGGTSKAVRAVRGAWIALSVRLSECLLPNAGCRIMQDAGDRPGGGALG